MIASHQKAMNDKYYGGAGGSPPTRDRFLLLISVVLIVGGIIFATFVNRDQLPEEVAVVVEDGVFAAAGREKQSKSSSTKNWVIALGVVSFIVFILFAKRKTILVNLPSMKWGGRDDDQKAAPPDPAKGAGSNDP